MKKFTHLHIPETWKHYWTKYPEGYTVLESLMSWVSQVDEMVDSSNNVVDKVTSLDIKMDDFLLNFDKNLQTTVSNILKDWQDSGFLNIIINEILETKYHDLEVEVNRMVERVDDSTRANKYFWTAPKQPSARTDEDNYFIDAFRVTYDEIINDYMEPLRLSDTRYITRSSKYKDQSGTYDIWRYSFTPRNYTKTIIIDTGVHGGEITSLLIMLRFFHHLVNDYQKYPVLAYIRQNVQIVFTPVANPYGFDGRIDGSVQGNGRLNSRGVNINRNFDFQWAEYSGPVGLNYKGTAPNSENETKHIIDTMEDYATADAYITFHNTGTPDYDVYISYPKGQDEKIYGDLINYWVKETQSPVLNVGESDLPSSSNYGSNSKNIFSSLVEWCDRRTGGGTFTSKDITDGLTWFTNIILEHIRQTDNSNYFVERVYNHDEESPLKINPTGYWNGAERLKANVIIKNDGIVTVQTSITVKAEEGGTLEVCGMLGQAGNGLGTHYGERQLDKWGKKMTFEADETKDITIPMLLPVKKTTIGGQVVSCGFGVNFFATGGSFLITKYNSIFAFTQLDNAKPYKSIVD